MYLSPAGVKAGDGYFCFPPFSPSLPRFFSPGQHIRRGGGSTFQNVCKRPEHPAHPNTVHPAEKSYPSVVAISRVFLSRLTSPAAARNNRERARKIVARKRSSAFYRATRVPLTLRQGELAQRHHIFVGLYRGPVGVVTIDSWSQLFRRLKKERLESWGGKTSFPDIYFCLSKGLGTDRRTI